MTNERQPLLLRFANPIGTNERDSMQYDPALMLNVVDGNEAHEQRLIGTLAGTRKTAVERETTDDE